MWESMFWPLVIVISASVGALLGGKYMEYHYEHYFDCELKNKYKAKE